MDNNSNNKYFWKGDLVQLRQFKEEDTKRKVDELYDSEARGFLQDGMTDLPPVSPEQYKNLYKIDDVDLYDNNLHKDLRFAIEDFNNQFVGWLTLWGRNPRSGVFSFGVSIFKEFRGKKYAKDAIKIILRYGFYELRMQKCNSGCRADNKASAALHKSLGFIEEGRIRREIFTNNRYYDLLKFGLLKEEFELIDS